MSFRFQNGRPQQNGDAAEAVVDALPRQFTNQQLIDAFARASNQLGHANPWSLMETAGLRLFDLAADRDALYSGQPLAALPNLSDAERALVERELFAMLGNQNGAGASTSDMPTTDIVAPWTGVVTATAGLSLRVGPSSDHARIRTLPAGTAVRVLAERGDWLSVAIGEEMGFVHRSYIARLEDEIDVPPGGGTNGTGLRLPPEQTFVVPADATPEMAAIAHTWNRYGAALTQHAERLGIEPGIAVAVLVAESQGDAFGADGRMIIRFEAHIFFQEWGEWGAENRRRFADHFQFNAEQPWLSSEQRWRATPDDEWEPVHRSQDSEWRVFNFARTLDETAAMRSISMGMPQIMGFNHRHAGYERVAQMFNAFQADAHHQIDAFFQFLQSRGALDALRRDDLHEFATIYNGPGQAAAYAHRIRERLSAFQQLSAAAVIPASRVRSVHLVGRQAPQARAAATSEPSPLGLPMPPNLPYPVDPVKSLADVDSELYAAWRQHIIQGFEKNNKMFDSILDAFMKPYHVTVTMNRLLFGIGILSFITAAALSLWTQNVLFSLAFNGLSAVAFITYFLSRPMQALEENLQFITWLGIIYNTYWTRLAYSMDMKTVQQDIEDATNDAMHSIQELMATHAERSGKRPNIPAGE